MIVLLKVKVDNLKKLERSPVRTHLITDAGRPQHRMHCDDNPDHQLNHNKYK